MWGGGEAGRRVMSTERLLVSICFAVAKLPPVLFSSHTSPPPSLPPLAPTMSVRLHHLQTLLPSNTFDATLAVSHKVQHMRRGAVF